jgi:hypothetical protein
VPRAEYEDFLRESGQTEESEAQLREQNRDADEGLR